MNYKQDNSRETAQLVSYGMEAEAIHDISAELLLNYLYPEMWDKWVAHYAGTFYRNYNHDAMTILPDSAEVELARDGFMKLLPEGLLSDEEELRGRKDRGNHERLKQRKQMMQEAFMPFDTFLFRQRLLIERHVSDLLETKLDYLLKTYFHFDLAAEPNPYVRQLAVLLPCVSKLRADYGTIARLLGVMFHCKVLTKSGRYSHRDTTRCWIPSVEYQLLMPGLTADEVRRLLHDIAPLQQFLGEWFIPAEVRCTVTVKHHAQPQTVGQHLILDYNTEFG